MQEQLSPPWYTLWNEINTTIGCSPDVNVGTLNTSNNPYTIDIKIKDHDKAVATASIMLLNYQFGNIGVQVNITDSDGDTVSPVTPESADELGILVTTALSKNSWFQEVVVKKFLPSSQRSSVYPVFSKGVVQFYNDNLTDLYSNYNNVAAFVFNNVLNLSPGGITVLCSTAES